MQDRPTALELIQAIREYLEGEVLPALGDPQLRYGTLIVAHALGIVERELPDEPARLRAELGALQDLLGLPHRTPPTDEAALRRQVLEANRELCQRIRKGMADVGPARQRVLAHLHAMVEEKVRINNPGRLEILRQDAD